MEDDDGLLLNFTSNPTASAGKQARPRSTADKKRIRKSAPPKHNGQRSNKVAAVRNDSIPSRSDATATATSEEGEKVSNQPKIVHGKSQVISSLFTANPKIREPVGKILKKKSDIPSNAPLADLATFMGLGIESDLVDLLENKLGISAPTNVQRKAIPLLLGPSRTVRGAEIPSSDVDAVVQAETGSGKTLTYLLPIVNRLVAASTYDTTTQDKGFGDRGVGTVAIILTPTRELAQQVAGVLTQLINLPKPKDEKLRRVHWIVPGLVIGGDNKGKEKARLRKGVNILVSTPGRLLDHLQNTKSFDISNLKWLVLDEADRLLDLGFEETLKSIMSLIDERTKAGGSPKYREMMQGKQWPSRRQTVLCSATLRDDVKHLAGWSLVNPAFVSGSSNDENDANLLKSIQQKEDEAGDEDHTDEMKFTAPNQLKQTYVITPAKLRLITLVTFLRSCFWDVKNKPTKSKVIVFFSCCDSVDFHYDLFGHADKTLEEQDESEDEGEKKSEKKTENKAPKEMSKNDKIDLSGEVDMMKKALDNLISGSTKKEVKAKPKEKEEPVQLISKILGNAPVFRLHGDLKQQTRTRSYNEFGKASSGVLLCTDVAARGLDLPNVDRIVQYDAPTDLKDYVHRVGRTARLGKAGEALLFLLPSEIEYLDILKAQDNTPERVTVESILQNLANSRRGGDYQTPAQELQNKMETYVLAKEEHAMLARKAYWSSVRAYATHSAAEKHIFHIRKIHLGHLAKSFALREAPSSMHEVSKSKKKKVAKLERMPGSKTEEKKKNPMKRTYDQASEFAIASASSLVTGPTTKQRKKNKSGKK